MPITGTREMVVGIDNPPYMGYIQGGTTLLSGNTMSCGTTASQHKV